MDFREIGMEDVDWIRVAWDREQWRAAVTATGCNGREVASSPSSLYPTAEWLVSRLTSCSLLLTLKLLVNRILTSFLVS
jgi:hypothetical protein